MADGEIVTPASLIREQHRAEILARLDVDMVPDDLLDRAEGVRKTLRLMRHGDLADVLASSDRITRLQAMAQALRRGLPPNMVATVAQAAAAVQAEAEYREACNLAIDGKTSRGDAFRAIKQMDDEARAQSRDAGRGR